MAGSHEGTQAETEAEDAPREKVRIFHCVIQTLLLLNTRCNLLLGCDFINTSLYSDLQENEK